MAQILIATSGLTGILNASFEVANRLVQAGHDVVLAAPRDRGEKARAEGFEFLRLPDVTLQPAPEQPANPSRFQRLKYRFDFQKVRREAALSLTRPTGFTTEIERLKPDLLLIDVELHEYVFTAYAQGWKFTLLSQWYSLWDQPGLPYVLTHTVPGQGWAGSKTAIWLHWQRVKLQRAWMFWKMSTLSMGTDRRSVLRALARETNFPQKFIKKNFWPGPFTYTGLPVLSMAPLEMEFPHQPPAWLTYVGPMVYKQRRENDSVSTNGYNAAAIIARKRATGARLIVCTVSTLSAGDGKFLNRVIEAVGARPDWLLAIGLGGGIEKQQVASKFDNVFPFAYAPQLRLLQEADLSINHGGIHTIHECLDFKVAMLVYSGKRSDQPGCAARVHYHGLGIMADKDQDDVTEIRTKISRLLEEHRFSEAVDKMHKATRHYQLNGKLEQIIIESIQSPLLKQPQ